MKRRLSAKFLAGYLMFGIISFCIVAVLGTFFYTRAASKQTAEELYMVARKIAARQTDAYSSGTEAYTFAELTEFARLSGHRLLIVDPTGRITYDSSSGSGLAGHTLTGFDPAASSDYYRIGNFYQAFPGEMLSVITPVTTRFQTVGYITLHQQMSLVRERADSMLRAAYLIFVSIFAVSFVLIAILRRSVLRPLRIITHGASEFAGGKLSHKIEVTSRDEFGYLADVLNDMARELQSGEEYQKKFIANVSHDFRSPLTSIRGYLQAMLDGVIPPELQERYLHIIIGETDRLANLTQSMLSLNSLDSPRLQLEKSDFDIIELIRTVCATFEGVCLPRHISFDLIFSQPSALVRADMGRISQVLHNLIDNAIKFSPDHSTIRVRVYTIHEKVSISVKDFGIGIPKESIRKIWTRFYKTDASRGKDRRGTGLGLAIVKEILQAHHETIDVVSTEGSGTEFIFHLPKGGERQA